MSTLAEKRNIALAKMQAFVIPKKVDHTEKKEESADVQNEQFDTSDKPSENELIRPSSFGLRPLYSRVDINCDKWLLTMDEASRAKLENPPSLADGLDIDAEAELRYLGCELIQVGAILLRLPQTAAATGQILYQRFYYQKSFVRYRFEHTVMACLLLASKIEEEPRRPRDVYNVFHRMEQLHRLRQAGRSINKETTARLKPRPLDVSYVNSKNNMIKAERRLLSTLGFVVHVKHPHKLIVSYIFSLKCSERKDLIQKAWSYMNDGLRTDMFLRYTPETIACSCIFLAARTVQPPIALPSSPFPWFELFDASDRDVQTIALMLQKLYTRQKTPEWNKIDAILEKMRSQKETSEKTSKAQQVAQKLTETKSVGNGKDSRDNSERDENRRERGRSRSRSRSRTPIKRAKFSPGRRRRDSPDRNGKYGRDSKGRGGKGGYRDERRDRDKRDEKRRRSRSRDRMDRDRLKERSKLREKEVYQSLGKRPRNHTPSPPSRIRK